MLLLVSKYSSFGFCIILKTKETIIQSCKDDDDDGDGGGGDDNDDVDKITHIQTL
jgi:hypothetical protein